MALDKLTIIDGGGLSTTSNYRVGIITATKFIGPIEGTITSADATFTGSVSIGGTLTYEDVTNVDSVGLVTAREGIFLPDNKEAKFGNTAASPDLKIYSGGTHSNIVNTNTSGYLSLNTDNFRIQDDDGNDNIIRGFKGGKVELFHNDILRLETTNVGAKIDTVLLLNGAAGNPGRLRLQEGGALSEIIGTRNSDANSDLQFKTERGDGTQVRAKINYSGDFVVPSNKVGIGTDNPDTKLHVAGSGNESISLKLEPGTTAGNYSELVIGRTSSAPAIQTTPVVKGGIPVSGVPGILFGSENTNLPAIGFQTPNSSNGHIVFKPKGSEKVRITSSGSVSIGNNASPDGKLHVYSSSAGTVTADAGGDELVLESSGNTGLSILSPGSGESTIFFGNPGTNGQKDGYIRYYHETHSTTANRRSLVFITGGGDSERLRITSDGKLGINRTSPAERLEVAGNIAIISGSYKIDTHPLVSYANFTDISGGSYAARLGSTGTSTIRSTQIYGGGNHIATFDGVNYRLGINETSPDDRIEIRTTAHGQGVTIKSTGNTSNAVTFDANRGTQGVIGVVYGRWNGTTVAQMSFVSGDDGTDKNDGYITFGTESAASNGNVNAGEKMRLDSSGRLGIGTNSPTSALHVVNSTPEIRLTNSTTPNEINSGMIRFTEYTNSYQGMYITYNGDTNILQLGRHTANDSVVGNDIPALEIERANGHIRPGAAGTQDLGSTTREFRNLYLGDGGSVYLGNEQDVRMFYDAAGSASFTIDANAGYTYINSDALRLNSKTSAWNYLRGDKSDGVVKLYKSNSERLATSEAGITVTGEVATSQDYPNFRPTLDLNFAATKKLDSRIAYSRAGTASYHDEFGNVKFSADNEPRFDHDLDTGECKGLLIEESRTNITPYTDLSQFGGHNIIKTANNAVAPDGTTTAAKIEHGGSGTSYLDHINNSINAAGAGSYTYSVWLKAPDDQPDGYYGCRIAVLHSTGGNIEPTLSLNKTWTRYTVTKTFGASDPGKLRVHPVMFRAAPGSTYDGKVIPSYVWAWGAQIEAGAFATSYIPNAGSTRGADIVDIDGEDFTDFYNQSEGTLLSSHTLLPNVPNTENVYVYQIQDASTNNVIRVVDRNSSYSNVATGIVLNGGSSQFHFNNTTDSYTKDKVLVALSVKQDDFAGCHNGGDLSTDNSGTLPTNFNKLGIGRYPPLGGYELNGHIQRFIYYPKQLSDSQLKTLTS